MTKPSGGSPGALLVHIPNHSLWSPVTLEFVVEFLVRNPDASAVTFDLFLDEASIKIKEWLANSAPGAATTNFRLTWSWTINTGGFASPGAQWSIKGNTLTSGKTLHFSEIDFTVREISG